MTVATALFFAFLIGQRLVELRIAKRHTAALLARGAVEHGAAHYPLIVALHIAWIAAIVILGWSHPVVWGWLAVFGLLQLFRVWILASLGTRWTTRIIVLNEPLVARGPYKFLPHPNYMLVVAEIFVAPMVLGLWGVALIFTVLNAIVLTIRIRAENKALRPLR
ncbi:Isoprenylcysteine carboxyl methyltransferase (ICMT) family protein [Rhodobacteraceae bacterium THAF1]|uniref:isoprenylcysteine carboxyl methyltransferase family protein n=1 Tax=Palleronia sp. THAF1 TaxID=2587842 RepID=UPI000F3D7AF6|nr:isoprenylcysteine carboxylmethyltransferase family protein [Palleronia sp. THAF1]QFU07444.1 Isoprenylcysteine carboxyl methyltransferase (ICMT) family protein [Palleronia sp. THAF1]VDC20644.1 Isoprenylcysteine carboxyl methyltransferase (ICMT) family protein [Rhodobacteraceae bacterium THAF1]